MTSAITITQAGTVNLHPATDDSTGLATIGQTLREIHTAITTRRSTDNTELMATVEKVLCELRDALAVTPAATTPAAAVPVPVLTSLTPEARIADWFACEVMLDSSLYKITAVHERCTRECDVQGVSLTDFSVIARRLGYTWDMKGVAVRIGKLKLAITRADSLKHHMFEMHYYPLAQCVTLRTTQTDVPNLEPGPQVSDMSRDALYDTVSSTQAIRVPRAIFDKAIVAAGYVHDPVYGDRWVLPA